MSRRSEVLSDEQWDTIGPLLRVFALDVTRCPACGGRLRLIAVLTEPASIQRYLQGVGLPTEPPPSTPPRAPPQQEWDFAY